MIADAFKGIKSKYIKVKIPPVHKVDTDVKFKNRDYDMQIVTVACCNKEIGLMLADLSEQIIRNVMLT